MKKILTVIVLIVIIGGIWLLTDKKKLAAPETSGTETNAEMLATNPDTKVTTETVAYYGTTKGYYVRPEVPAANGQPYPGVIMIHEWWGLNDQIKDMVVTLAKDGYQVLAVDLYNGKIAATSAEAQAYRTEATAEETTKNLQAARSFLEAKGASKIASLGWCYGGGKSLELALSGIPLDATVIYYGTLQTEPATLRAIKWPVLGIFGEADQSIPVTTVEKFDAALDSLGVKNEIHVYPGVGHAFANPTGMNYAAAATKDAWEKTKAFLAANLKN